MQFRRDIILDRMLRGRCRAFRRMRKADIYDNLKITLAYLASINNSKLSGSKHHRMLEPHFISCLRCTSKKVAHHVIA